MAELAERFLSPEARSAVGPLLQPHERLAEIADWADDYRKRCRNTGPWHYVNIPLEAARYEPLQHCADKRGCVVRALSDARAVLGDRARSLDDRSFALRLIVHFVGDLHQPLHSGDRGDRGGNDLRVVFEHRQSNLHRVWDHALIEWTGRSVPDYADMLARSLRDRERARMQRGTIVSWVEEAQRVARRAYRGLPRPKPHAPPIELGERYAKAMLATLDEQLLRAGVRLAHVLETALASPGAPAADELLASIRRCAAR